MVGGLVIYFVLDWDKIFVVLFISFVVVFFLGVIVYLFVFVLFKIWVFVYNWLCNEKKIDIIGIFIDEIMDIEKCSVDIKYWI